MRNRTLSVTIGANNQKLWRGMCRVIGAIELLADERFVDNDSRMANREELIRILEPYFAKRTTDEWVELFLADGLPAGAIRDYAYVLDEDPHVKARNMIGHFDHPVEGTIPVLASPIRLYGTPATIRTAPPLLGQHTDTVLSELLSLPAERADAPPPQSLRCQHHPQHRPPQPADKPTALHANLHQAARQRRQWPRDRHRPSPASRTAAAACG